ncbi:MAG: HAMP domain-containing histidine kinase [Gemmatimonadota bacterium]|nr:HAMP domain-containing histidine kinase [Gemmatimonadota bacterium]
MTHPRPSRLIGTVVVLGLALVITATLVYQAQVAARGHRLTAEHTLKDYASFAAWQFSQQARNELLTNEIPSLAQAAMRVNPERLPESLLSPDAVGVLARSAGGWCRCLDSVRYYFRLDWPDGPLLTTATNASSGELRWVRDTILAYVRRMPPLKDMRPRAYGSSDATARERQQMRVIVTNDSYVMILGGLDIRPRLLVFLVSRNMDGRPVVVYGYETPPLAFLTPAFQAVYRRGALLPPSLVGNLPLDSVLSLAAEDGHGNPLFGSPGQYDLTYSAADTLDANFGQLVLRAALRPDVAGRLLVGGLPPSRGPMLLALALLMAILLAIALVQLRREQELARLRTEFVSGVSHELRTPLAQIRWFSELLHMGKLRSEEERTRSAAIIDQEARRLTYLVENVLTFSRSERRLNRIAPAPTDVAKELHDALELFAPLARSRQMKLRAEVELGLVALVDRNALRQILLNLLDNAAKYGPEGQTITVGSSRTREWVRIWIDDEGPGVSETDRARVWEPYVRLGRDSDRGTGGSGIGLSVVRELVAMHGGHCSMEASPGGGVRVVFTLPASHADVPEESPA